VSQVLEKFRPLFYPRGIIVTGVSQHPGKFGTVTLHNLLSRGYEGELFPINREGLESFGHRTYKSISEVPQGRADLAFICTPSKINEELLRQCAGVGVRAAFVASAGYGEADGGKESARRLVALGEELGWRGFYLPRLQKQRSALASSIVVGVAWGLWHIPTQVLAFRQYGLLAILANVLVTHILGVTAQTITMTWVHNNVRQSLLLMVLSHYGITFTAMFLFPLSMSVIAGLQHWLIYAACYWLAALIVIAIAGPKRLVRESRSAQDTYT